MDTHHRLQLCAYKFIHTHTCNLVTNLYIFKGWNVKKTVNSDSHRKKQGWHTPGERCRLLAPCTSTSTASAPPETQLWPRTQERAAQLQVRKQMSLPKESLAICSPLPNTHPNLEESGVDCVLPASLWSSVKGTIRILSLCKSSWWGLESEKNVPFNEPGRAI